MPPPSSVASNWLGFLGELDNLLEEPVTLECLGGFVVSVLYGLPRPTSDLDYLEIIPSHALAQLQTLAGEGSGLWKRHGVNVQHVTVASLPDRYAERLLEILPEHFTHLRLWGLEAHDLALSKLSRNFEVDREDVQFLARTVPLDPTVLRSRYLKELRPIVIGDPREHDLTLDMWLESYFPGSH